MGEYSKVEIDGRLMIVTINRPEVYNALHPMANQELSEAFDEFAANPERGSRSLPAPATRRSRPATTSSTTPRCRPRPASGRASAQGLRRPHQSLRPRQAGDRRRERRRHGGGFEIALACDIIVASDKARFALPEPRVGLAAGAGGMQRLSRMIPLKKAMGMMLTGRHVPAQEGYELGFVTEVVPHAELMAAAKSGPATSSPARRCRCARPSRW